MTLELGPVETLVIGVMLVADTIIRRAGRRAARERDLAIERQIAALQEAAEQRDMLAEAVFGPSWRDEDEMAEHGPN